MSPSSSTEASPKASPGATDYKVAARESKSITDGGSATSSGSPERSLSGGEDIENGEIAPENQPLPTEAPPLPDEAPPSQPEDDGWAPVWDDNAQAFYFFNRFTNKLQWDNPRVPEISQPAPPGVGNYDRIASSKSVQATAPRVGGYDPAIHGDYDPNADYARSYETSTYDDVKSTDPAASDPSQTYTAAGTFNRFTGKWQAADLNPEKFNDENKSRRQMNAFFDVDAAANSHDGKSLKAERSGKKLSKKELKAFKEKRRERKEEKRRAWLRD